MKKILNKILALGIVSTMFATSCVDQIAVGDPFLEKAPGVDVNIETIFSNPEYVRNFLWSAYSQLYCTYTNSNMMNGAPIDVLSDSYHCYCSWGGPIQSYYPGSLTENAQDTEDSNFQGKFSYSTRSIGSDAGGRVSIYETIRKCWQIIENIESVPGMDDMEKSRIRGEAYTIMASRYFDAFRNFGGLCLVKKAYGVGEEFTDGRATAMETVEYIDELIGLAIAEPGFIWNIPNNDIGQWSGRLTRASARALRAKVWMFAASPLFNNAAPYMKYEDSKVTEFTNINHVWFGKEDPSLWERCLKYCDEFFSDNAANGDYYQLVQPTSQDEAGYRTAYRRAYRYRNDETHHEKIFDVHPTKTLSDGGWGWGWAGFALDCYRQGGAVPTNELVECFGMSDGRLFPYTDIYGAGRTLRAQTSSQTATLVSMRPSWYLVSHFLPDSTIRDRTSSIPGREVSLPPQPSTTLMTRLQVSSSSNGSLTTAEAPSKWMMNTSEYPMCVLLNCTSSVPKRLLNSAGTRKLLTPST